MTPPLKKKSGTSMIPKPSPLTKRFPNFYLIKLKIKIQDNTIFKQYYHSMRWSFWTSFLIVDFLPMAKFSTCPNLYATPFSLLKWESCSAKFFWSSITKSIILKSQLSDLCNVKCLIFWNHKFLLIAWIRMILKKTGQGRAKFRNSSRNLFCLIGLRLPVYSYANFTLVRKRC